MRRVLLLIVLLLAQLGHVVASLWMAVAILTGGDRAWGIALAWDRLLNTVTGGQSTETVSSRANRARSEGRRWGCVLCRILDRLEKDHCSKSAGV
jgi:hypothetical protein